MKVERHVNKCDIKKLKVQKNCNDRNMIIVMHTYYVGRYLFQKIKFIPTKRNSRLTRRRNGKDLRLKNLMGVKYVT